MSEPMVRRIAQPGDYLINLYTKEIKKARHVFSVNGTAIVEEFMPLFEDSPEITEWTVFEYLVIPDPVDPSLLG